MGKAGKTRRHDAKMKARRAAKAARKATYLSLRGTSKKAKKQSSSRHVVSGVKHPVEDCGNIGCGRCYPQYIRKIHNGRVAA